MNKILEACLADKWLKLLALGLAVVTWVYVSTIARTTDKKTVNLTFEDPQDHFILPGHPTKVTAKVEGPEADVRRLPTELRARIDVASKQKGSLPTEFKIPQSVSIALATSDIRDLRGSLTIKEFDPPRVNITLDQMDKKLLPVKIDQKQDLKGKVKEGFQIHKIYPTPSQVIVRGPRSVLARMDSIRPKLIPVGGLSGQHIVKGWPLDTFAKIGEKRIDCLTVPNLKEVSIVVVPKYETLKVKNVPLEVRGLPGLLYTVFIEDKTKLFTEVAEVEIRGPKKALDDPRVRAFVDLTDIKDPKEKPEVKRELQFSAEPGVEVLTKPPSVVVQIKTAAGPE